MSKKDRIIYSTNPGFRFDADGNEAEITPAPHKQMLYVHFEKKHRAGKKVTLVEGFTGTNQDLNALAADLRKKCGVGGSAKDGVALLQGDHCTKIKGILRQQGFKVKG